MLTSYAIRHAKRPCMQLFQPMFLRTFYDSVKPMTKDYSEVEIKVPWGKIAGKLWGSQEKQPVLATHGWQDNAGTFDNLIPLLPKDVPILAIDLPGHGLSSWLPPGMIYHELMYVMLIDRIRRKFNWEKLKLMGHSFSACFLHLYIIFFPQNVDFMIAIDALKPPSMDLQFNDTMAHSITDFYKWDDSGLPPLSYTKEEVIERWSKAIPFGLEPVGSEIMMIRGTRKLEDGKLIFNRDPRLKIKPFLWLMTQEYYKESATRITCPYLLIRMKNSLYPDMDYHEILDIMRNNNKDVHYTSLPGGHHLHLLNPSPVADAINPFLEKYNR